jgi:hypothetical protein
MAGRIHEMFRPAPLGLTPSAHAILLTLRERGSLPLTELYAAVRTDPRNMGPVLDAIHR